MVAVVAREHDDRVLREPEPVQRVHDAPHLGIHEADTRIVGLHGLPTQIIGQRPLLGLAAAESRRGNVRLVLLHAAHHRHVRLGVVSEIRIPRRDKRRVGPEKADREEEGPILPPRRALQHPFRIGREQRVGVMLVAFRRGIPAQGAAEIPRHERKDLRLFLEPVDSCRVECDLPRSRIVVPIGPDRTRHAIMIQLADSHREVALVPEGLRQAHVRGNRLPEHRPVAEHARTVGVQPGEHRVPARAAQRIRAVRAIEAHAARREAVEIRRPGARIAGHGQHICEVIRDEEQHIRLRPARGGGVRREGEHEREQDEEGVGSHEFG